MRSMRRPRQQNGLFMRVINWGRDGCRGRCSPLSCSEEELDLIGQGDRMSSGIAVQTKDKRDRDRGCVSGERWACFYSPCEEVWGHSDPYTSLKGLSWLPLDFCADMNRDSHSKGETGHYMNGKLSVGFLELFKATWGFVATCPIRHILNSLTLD